MEEDNLTLLRNYKTNQPIESVDDLPVPSAERIQTDRFCIIFSTLFAVGMFITAIACLDLNKLQRMTYPTDQQGRHCTLDNGNYNYLYFTSPSDPVWSFLCRQNDCVWNSVQKEMRRNWNAGQLKIYHVRRMEMLTFRWPFMRRYLPRHHLGSSARLRIKASILNYCKMPISSRCTSSYQLTYPSASHSSQPLSLEF